MQTDINALVAGFAGDGAISGCATTAQGTPDMTVAVASGIIQISDTEYSISGTNKTITAADGGNPRIDLICANTSSALTVTDGTAAVSPKAPDIPANSILLAMIYVPANDTDIDSNQITDKRVIVNSNSGEIFLSAVSGWPSTTNGCSDATKTEYITNDQDLYSLDFDQTSIEYAQWTMWMPDNWNAGTITFKAVWTAAAGTPAQAAEWNLQGRSYANDDAIDQAWGSSVEVSDALIATSDIHYSSESSAVTLAGTPAIGELVQLRAWRDATNDTLAADAKLIGIKVYYIKA